MPKFRKKPVVIEAMRVPDGEIPKEWGALVIFLDGADWNVSVNPLGVKIRTLEGEMQGIVGDWIIKGVKGEFYPCKPDIFEATYEPAQAREEPRTPMDREAMIEHFSRLLADWRTKEYVHGENRLHRDDDEILHRDNCADELETVLKFFGLLPKCSSCGAPIEKSSGKRIYLG